MQTIGIIPARYGSTRFPGKPLAKLRGKPMVQHVYERARLARCIDKVIIATDDSRIAEAAGAFGAEVAMTDAAHCSGTDRCAEVAERLPAGCLVLNIQGDEPFIAPEQIDLVAEPLRQPGAAISTLCKKIASEEELFDPNVVKVVLSQSGRALYFSRSTLPHLRGIPPEQWLQAGVFLKHIGLYGFQREALLEVATLPPGRYEQAESLEQLRWLEAGYPIQVRETELETVGIDTPEDLKRVGELGFRG